MKIPDTLDLTSMARAGLNYLDRTIDPENEGYVYFANSFLPPSMKHHPVWGHGDLMGRYLQAFVFARAIRETNEITGKEWLIRKALCDSFQEDGLSQLPVHREPKGRRVISMWNQSRVLLGQVTLFMETGDEEIARNIDGLIRGLEKISTREGNCRYYPANTLVDGRWDAEYPAGGDLPHGVLINPLVKYYRLTNRAAVIEFAQELARGVLEKKGVFSRMFDPAHGSFGGHFHSHAATVVGLINLGRVTNNDRHIHWGRQCFDWIRSEQNANRGSSFGWFPENNWGPSYGCGEGHCRTVSETCCAADMIEMALALAQCGHRDLWGEAERYLRNYIVESQLLALTDDYLRLLHRLVPNPDEAIKIAHRLLGGFAAAFRPNDLIHSLPEKGNDLVVNMMGCCPPAGINAVFYVWNNIVTAQEDEVTVNFALNRRSPWLDVRSWLPHRGRIELVIHKKCRLRVRLPPWVKEEESAAFRNGQRIPMECENDLLRFRAVQPRDRLLIEFPLLKTETRECVGGTDAGVSFTEGRAGYTVRWRGNTVISLNPEGRHLPTFQRRHLDTDDCPSREVDDHAPCSATKPLDF